MIMYIIIALAAFIVLVFAALMYIGFAAFKRMFHVNSFPVFRRMEQDPLEKAAEKPEAERAKEEFEKAKRFFFTRPVKGSPYYLKKEDWAVEPFKLSVTVGNRLVYAYFHSASDFSEKDSYEVKAGTGASMESKTHSNKWAVLLHGYGGCGLDNTKIAYQFLKRGFNVLSPDLIGHGGDTGKFVSFGFTDAQIIKRWIASIIEKDTDAHILLYGCSMGAAAALFTLKGEKVRNVKCVISDSSFLSIWDECTVKFKKYSRLPLFPFLNIVNLYARLFLGYNLKKASLKEVLAANTDTPALFIHGASDRTVSPDCAKELYKVCAAPKKLVIFENAGHYESMFLNFDEYFKELDSFIDAYIKEL